MRTLRDLVEIVDTAGKAACNDDGSELIASIAGTNADSLAALCVVMASRMPGEMEAGTLLVGVQAGLMIANAAVLREE